MVKDVDSRKISRTEWNFTSTVDGGFEPEQVNTGSLQRIADSCEKMAQRHTELIDERDCLRRCWVEEIERRAARDRQIVALRGVITKLKKQLAEAKQ